MPPASGIALGFDRLVMLATGAQRIEQVLWTPVAGAAVDSRGMTEARAPALGTGRGRPCAPPEQLADLARVAARYAVAITPAHRRPDRSRRSARSDRAAVRARHRRADDARPRSAPTRSATTRISPVEGIVHRYPDRVLLKLVDVCAVYCRFCFRREMVGPGQADALSGEQLDAALGYIARAPGDLGGDPHRRRSAGALGAPARAT